MVFSKLGFGFINNFLFRYGMRQGRTDKNMRQGREVDAAAEKGCDRRL